MAQLSIDILEDALSEVRGQTPAATPKPSDPFEDALAAVRSGLRPEEVTPLSPPEEIEFLKWATSSGIEDLDLPDTRYDYRGFFKANGPVKYQWGEDHLPDTWKQHGHETFSIESKYSKGTGDGGRWDAEHFIPATDEERETGEGERLVLDIARSMQPAAPKAPGAPPKPDDLAGIESPFQTEAPAEGVIRGAVGLLKTAAKAAAQTADRLTEAYRAPAESTVPAPKLDAEAAKHANEMLEGLFAATAPLMAVGAVTNPVGTAGALVRFWLVQQAGEKVADELGADPEVQTLVGNLAGVLSGGKSVKDFVNGNLASAASIAKKWAQAKGRALAITAQLSGSGYGTTNVGVPGARGISQVISENLTARGGRQAGTVTEPSPLRQQVEAAGSEMGRAPAAAKPMEAPRPVPPPADFVIGRGVMDLADPIEGMGPPTGHTEEIPLRVAPGDTIPIALLEQVLGEVRTADLDAVRADVNVEPTEAQKEAGNYRKGHLKLHGLDISIENPVGSTRSGKAPDGSEWSVEMPADYGYVRRTEGADGDQVDVYLGPDPQGAGTVFVIDQIDPKTGQFDEHKAVIGVQSEQEARALYEAAFTDGSGPSRIAAVTALPVAEFATWAKEGDTDKPLAARMGASADGVQDQGATARGRADALPEGSAPVDSGRGTADAPLTEQERRELVRLRARKDSREYEAAVAAAPAETIDRLVARATAEGYTGDAQRLRDELGLRLKAIEEFDAIEAESGYNGITLLKAVARYGGISTKKETTYPGELKRLLEMTSGRSTKKEPFGALNGVQGVRNDKDGQSFDRMLEAVQQDQEFSHIESVNDLIEALDEAATYTPDRRIAADKLEKSLGIEWWRAMEPPDDDGDLSAGEDGGDPSFDPDDFERDLDAIRQEDEEPAFAKRQDTQTPSLFDAPAESTVTVDRNEHGEEQQRLPGAEQVRDTENATPEFEAPFSLTSETSKRKGTQQPLFSKREEPAPVFYSALTRAAEGLTQQRGTPEQMAAMLKKAQGVKQAELDWTGVLPWIQSQGKFVTKADIVAFLQANELQVTETTLGHDRLTTEEFQRYRDMNQRLSVGHILKPEELPEYDRLQALNGEFTPTKFSAHALPGGTGYRELLITLPQARAPFDPAKVKIERKLRSTTQGSYALSYDGQHFGDGYDLARRSSTPDEEIKAKGFLKSDDEIIEQMREQYERSGKYAGVQFKALRDTFSGGHFDEPNVLVHIRFDDRQDSDGQRVLFIEEVQSDWHQKGRREGYAEVQPNTGEHKESRPWRVGDTLYASRENAEAAARSLVPSAPFKTTWQELALKRMVRYAAEHGYDKLAWTTGEIQADRYDLSKQVRAVFWQPNEHILTVELPDGEHRQIATDATVAKLADYIGKDAAEKIVAPEAKDTQLSAAYDSGDNDAGALVHSLRGVDLKVGGSGMKGFYDSILPAFLNKWAKPFGGRVGTTQVKVGTEGDARWQVERIATSPRDVEMFELRLADGGWATDGRTFTSRNEAQLEAGRLNMEARKPIQSAVHALTITDQMRESALKGQPLFARRFSIKGLIAQATQQSRLADSTYRDMGSVEMAGRPVAVMDSGTRFSPEELERVVANPDVQGLAGAVFGALDDIIGKVIDKDAEKLERTGLLFDDHSYGVFVPKPKSRGADRRATILINPFEHMLGSGDALVLPDLAADRAYITAVHEALHWHIGLDGPDFDTALAGLLNQLGQHFALRATNRILEAYADPTDRTRYRRGLLDVLPVYQASRRRPATAPDAISTARHRSERPSDPRRGAKPPPGDVRRGGSRTVTPDELKRLAAKRGTSIDVELARAQQAGYRISVEGLKGGAGAAAGLFANPSPQQAATLASVEFPELVDLARELAQTPQVLKAFRSPKHGDFSGASGKIRLRADLFKKGNERQLAATLAHEIGHLTDWLPHKTLKRGNILGRLYSLRNFLKHTFVGLSGADITQKDVRAELKALSDAWRPWDESTASASFKAYRNSSVELFADAISVLLNDPKKLEKDAPIFFREFFENLDRKPEVKRVYFDLQGLMTGTPGALIQHRREGVGGMFEEADTKAIDLERLRQEERKDSKKDVWLRTRIQLIDKNAPILDRLRALEKRGVRINPDDDPRYFLEERNYLGGKLHAFTARRFEPVYRALQKADIGWHTFGEALFYDRIIAGDRSEMANPRGISPAVAETLATDLSNLLTPEQRKVMRKATTDFRAAITQVAEEAYDVGLYTDDLHDQMQKNPAYVPFRVIDYLEKDVTSRVYRQIGTLKDIQNPADAAMLKTLVTIRAIEHQKVKKATFDFLEQHYAHDITQAKEVGSQKGRRPIESQDKAQHLITYYEKGKVRGKYVDGYIADMLNNVSVGQNFAVVHALRAVNSAVFRPAFTTFNLGFQSFNLGRDFLRSYKNTPDMTLGRVLKRYWQAKGLARVRAYGLPANSSPAQRRAFEDMLDAEEAMILSVTFNDLRDGREVQDTQVEDTLMKMGIGGFQTTPKSRLGKLLKPIADWIENTGNFIETLPKAAAIYEMAARSKKAGKPSIDDIPPDLRSFIRRKVGSPDFLAGGTYKPITNEIFLFSNAITQAMRADLEVASQPTTRSGFWWKTAALNIAPKLAMFGALLTLKYLKDQGDETAAQHDLRRALEGISEYDQTNYLSVPLGLDDQGNSVYLRLPQDDFGRLIGGLVWKTLRLARGDKDVIESAMQVVDYMAGQVPSVTPSVNLAMDIANFAAGKNIYDSFRSRFLFTDDELRARNFETFAKFVGYEFQQVGGGIVWRFTPGETRPIAKTPGQAILDMPVVSNVVGRWLRVSNQGHGEQLREAQRAVQKDEARVRLEERAAVNEAIRTYRDLPASQQTPQAQERLVDEAVAALYSDAPPAEQRDQAKDIAKKLRLGLLRGASDATTDALLSAVSNKQKVAILEQAARSMAADEFERWYKTALDEKIVSVPLAKAFDAARGR